MSAETHMYRIEPLKPVQLTILKSVVLSNKIMAKIANHVPKRTPSDRRIEVVVVSPDDMVNIAQLFEARTKEVLDYKVAKPC
jgi:hypothetical protein